MIAVGKQNLEKSPYFMTSKQIAGKIQPNTTGLSYWLNNQVQLVQKGGLKSRRPIVEKVYAIYFECNKQFLY